MASERKRFRGCLWGLLALFALMILVGTVILLAGMALRHVPGHRPENAAWGADEYPDLTEVWAYGSGEAKVVTVPIRGFITLDGSSGILGDVQSSSQLALMAIRRATLDADVRGLILDIDSGGGGITASDILYKALMDFREAGEGRVIVAIFGDVAASGAYYIAIAADHIMARPTSITGSIGVLMQSLNMRQLGEKLGIHDVTIKSGRNKDILNPLQDMTEEQRQLLQGIIDELYTRFVTLVAERRELPETRVREIADGRVITATEAVRDGLVDDIGYWDDAMRTTAELLEVDAVKVYRYEEEFSIYSFLKGAQHWNPANALLGRTDGARFLYHWQL